MDHTPMYVLPPASLTQLCTAKISICMVHSVLENKSADSLARSQQSFENMNTILKENVHRLRVPEKFVTYLRNYSLFVLRGVCSWYEEIEKICKSTLTNTRLSNQFLRNIVWTGRGKINQEETARNVVAATILSLDNRYRLACAFHLEDQVCLLWREMPEGSQCLKDASQESIRSMERFEVVYWSFLMKELPDEEVFKYIQQQLNIEAEGYIITFLVEYVGQFDGVNRQCVYMYALVYALSTAQSYSAQYFAAKCYKHHKTAILKSCYFYPVSEDFARVYYSLMDGEILEYLLAKKKAIFYYMFLDLPSELFMKAFRYFKPYMDDQELLQVLSAIAEHDMSSKEDGYISPLDLIWTDIFKEIWLNEVSESDRTQIMNDTANFFGLISQNFHSRQFENVDMLSGKLCETQRRALFAYLFDFYELCPSFEFFRRVTPHLVTSVDDFQYIEKLVNTNLGISD